MATPALNIPIRVNLDEFKRNMKEASSHAGTATKAITQQFLDLNQGVIGASDKMMLLSRSVRTVVRAYGPLAATIGAAVGVFKLMSYATELATEKIEEFSKTAERAGKAGLSTDFFQRMTKSGEELKLTVDEINTALDRFAQKSKGALGGSVLETTITDLTGYGNFKGNSGLAAVSGAVTNEEKIRATVRLITQALEAGERLAALDLAEKMFGPKVRDNLAANSNYLREMLATADKMAASKIISDEEIGRAIDLKKRLEEAQKVLSERFKPIQDDLAKLGVNYHESWVSIYENMASAVSVANQLYAALKDIPDIFARAGNSPFWGRVMEFFKARGLLTDPASLGIEAITSTGKDSPANRRLAGLLSNPEAVRQAMREAIDIQTKIRGDRSRPPPKTATSASSSQDPFESAIDSTNRRIALVNAETASIGQNSEARERARLVATLEEAAKRANAAAGKELYGVTEATNPKIKEQADRMLEAARAAREQAESFQATQDALRFAGNQLLDVLDRASERGANFGDIMRDVLKNLERQFLAAALTGEGAFGRLFGSASSNGGVGGILGALVSGLGGSTATMVTGLGAGTGGLSFPMFAAGTSYAPGGWALVGEKGPELLNLPRGSSVTPNHKLQTALAPPTPAIGGGSVTVAPTINVTVEGGSRGAQADAQMGEKIAKQLDDLMERKITTVLLKQLRPGGILKR